MQIKEVEDLLHITKPNIRFYEKQGLITPERKGNGYREYSEEDVETLRKVILFRKMGISIEEIKEILEGNTNVSEVVSKNVVQIEEQIKELEGVLDISRKMLKDQSLDRAFDLDKYWDIMEADEKQGFRFFEVVKDYMELESDLFFGTWNNVFFVNMRKIVAGKKWLLAVAIVGVICLIRGLFYHYLWNFGSVIEGALYPFAIFGMVSAIILPLYLMNKRFGSVESKEEEDNKKAESTEMGCIGNLLLFVGIIALVLLVMIGVPMLVDYLQVNDRNDTMNYVRNNVFAIVYIIMALYVIVTMYWLISKQGLTANRSNGEKGFVCRLPKKIRVLVAFVTLFLYFGTIWIYAVCYDQIDDNGFGRYRFSMQTRYEYADVEYYQLYAQHDGTLGMYFHMKDGSKFKYYGSLMSYDIDETQYANEEDDYVIEVARKLAESGVQCRVLDEKKLYKRLTYDYWDEVAEKIIAVSLPVE